MRGVGPNGGASSLRPKVIVPSPGGSRPYDRRANVTYPSRIPRTTASVWPGWTDPHDLLSTSEIRTGLRAVTFHARTGGRRCFSLRDGFDRTEPAPAYIILSWGLLRWIASGEQCRIRPIARPVADHGVIAGTCGHNREVVWDIKRSPHG